MWFVTRGDVIHTMVGEKRSLMLLGEDLSYPCFVCSKEMIYVQNSASFVQYSILISSVLSLLEHRV